MRIAVILLLFAAKPALAQPFTFGVKGGIRTDGVFSGDLTDESKRYTVGFSIDCRLPFHFSLEADALYQHSGFSATYNTPLEVSQTRERDNIWMFPVLAKYHLPGSRQVHPFAGIGVAPRIVTARRTQSGYSIDPFTLADTNPYSQTSSSRYDPTVGLVIAAGVEIGRSRLRFTPEVRYTRWNDRFLNAAIRNVGFLGLRSYIASDSELDVMLGIAWRAGRR